jgi:hypothetical protein
LAHVDPGKANARQNEVFFDSIDPLLTHAYAVSSGKLDRAAFRGSAFSS